MENCVPAKKLLATWNRDGDYKMKVRKASMPRLLITLEDISQIIYIIIIVTERKSSASRAARGLKF